jgi:hypothetical protein
MGTVFKGFWHGPELSPVHRLCLQTFIRRGHVFELYTYNPIDAGRLIPLSQVVQYVV